MADTADNDAAARAVRERDIDEVLAEFNGDARLAICALLTDLATLAADNEALVSRGYVWGRFLRPRLRVVGKIG